MEVFSRGECGEKEKKKIIQSKATSELCTRESSEACAVSESLYRGLQVKVQSTRSVVKRD